MTIEALISDLITQLPNLAVAAVVLFWQRQTIDRLLEQQQKLIDKLLAMVDDVREGERVVIDRNNAAVARPTTPEL